MSQSNPKLDQQHMSQKNMLKFSLNASGASGAAAGGGGIDAGSLGTKASPGGGVATGAVAGAAPAVGAPVRGNKGVNWVSGMVTYSSNQTLSTPLEAYGRFVLGMLEHAMAK